LAAAVESLPQAMRDLVVRRVFDREPFDSIARSLNTSPGAARVTWTRAIRKLREVLDSSSA
jgi:DNA-directed RNA polymerase specialized sigma24 family protein